MFGLVAAGGLSLSITTTTWAASLNEELLGLLQSHPGVLAAEKSVISADEEIKRSKARYYPRVDLSADMGPEVIDSPAERAAEDEDKNSSRFRKTAGITITENVFDGFSTSAQIRLAESTKTGTEHQRSAQTQQFLFEGISAYIRVLRQKRLVELARNNEDNIKTQLNLEDERVRRGAGMAVDVLQAKARLQFSKERRVSLEGQLADAVSRYKQVFDHAPEFGSMIEPVPPLDVLPESLDRAVEIGIRENPVVLSADATVDGARERKNQARSEYYPSVDIVGSWNYEEDKDATIGIRRDYSILLQAQWNLFNGFASQAGENRAATDYAASKDSRLLTLRKVEEQTRLAWQALVTSRQRVELLENAVNLASEVFTARKKLREAGKETVINVLDSENEVYTRQIDFTSASYDERLAVYQLLMAMGRLNPGYLGLKS